MDPFTIVGLVIAFAWLGHRLANDDIGGSCGSYRTGASSNIAKQPEPDQPTVPDASLLSSSGHGAPHDTTHIFTDEEQEQAAETMRRALKPKR